MLSSGLPGSISTHLHNPHDCPCVQEEDRCFGRRVDSTGLRGLPGKVGTEPQAHQTLRAAPKSWASLCCSSLLHLQCSQWPEVPGDVILLLSPVSLTCPALATLALLWPSLSPPAAGLLHVQFLLPGMLFPPLPRFLLLQP